MREIFTTDKAPKPIGPYSQAVRAGNFLFISGQTPIDPASGQMVAGGIEVQTERVFENLKGILAAAGLSLESVVKVSVFLKDMNEFAAMNGVYAKYFPASPPARSTIEAARLPRDARVEIDMIAAFE